MNLTFTGGRELARALRELPDAIAEEVLETAVVGGAGIIREAAAAKAPRPALRRRPGTVRLADSIKVTVTEKGHAYTTVTVGTKTPYAHLIEYGHQIIPRGPSRRGLEPLDRRRGKKGRFIAQESGQRALLRRALRERRDVGSRGFVPARPFLRPAFDENRERVLQRIAEVIAKGIELEVRKLNENLTRKAIAGETDPVAQLGVA